MPISYTQVISHKTSTLMESAMLNKCIQNLVQNFRALLSNHILIVGSFFSHTLFITKGQTSHESCIYKMLLH